jgi:Na+/glutamate symporter
MCKLQSFCCISLEHAAVLIGYFDAAYSLVGIVVSLLFLKFPAFILCHMDHKAFHGISKHGMKIFLLIIIATSLLLSISQFMSSILLISAVKKVSWHAFSIFYFYLCFCFQYEIDKVFKNPQKTIKSYIC